jgi:hypothetical protein
VGRRPLDANGKKERGREGEREIQREREREREILRRREWERERGLV